MSIIPIVWHKITQEIQVVRLNAEERALIEGRRAEKKKLVAHQAMTIKTLQVTTRYAIWLKKQGINNSYSTFINRFVFQ